MFTRSTPRLTPRALSALGLLVLLGGASCMTAPAGEEAASETRDASLDDSSAPADPQFSGAEGGGERAAPAATPSEETVGGAAEDADEQLSEAPREDLSTEARELALLDAGTDGGPAG